MDIRLANEAEKNKWNEFIKSTPESSFLQSWEWGEFKQAYGQRIWRLVAEEQGEWRAAALVIEHQLPFGMKWLYIPKGPLWKNGKWQSSNFPPSPPPAGGVTEGRGKEISEANFQILKRVFFNKIKDLGRREKAVLVKVEPPWGESDERDNLFFSGGDEARWRLAEKGIQPRNTLVIDLGKSEAELLAGMRQKTRYNIRLAEKRGVAVRFTPDAGAVDDFLRLTKEVSGRGDFHFHPERYYRAMQQILSPTGQLELAVAEYQGKVLAVHWLIYWADTVTYAHGASSDNDRAVMAPHLLQWRSMWRAKEKGAIKYDLFGVAPRVAPRSDAGRGKPRAHPWDGITRFKEGFGGERLTYAPARDMVLNPGAYYLLKVVRRAKSVLG